LPPDIFPTWPKFVYPKPESSPLLIETAKDQIIKHCKPTLAVLVAKRVKATT
jgi:hypothetical protein